MIEIVNECLHFGWKRVKRPQNMYSNNVLLSGCAFDFNGFHEIAAGASEFSGGVYFYNFGHEAIQVISWWRHEMETFSALLGCCVGNPPVIGGFPSQRPVTHRFDAIFYLRLNIRWSRQSKRRRFETLSRPSWRHCNVTYPPPPPPPQHTHTQKINQELI